MTLEEIRELTGERVEARLSEIAQEIDVEGADLETLNAEVDALKERKELLIKEAETRAELAQKIATGKEAVEVKEEIRSEEKSMDIKEIRNSGEYIEAFANYIKTGDDTECRTLLTTNAPSPATGTVPVPTFIEGIIKTAWENEPILSRVRKTFVKGNLKVGYEASASDAVVHNEGAAAIDEESLTIAVVNLVPATIKKWISVSDEVLDMDAGDFLRYIYNELAYRIVKKLAALVVADIIESADGSTVQAPSISSAATTLSTASIITAEGEVSDEAGNLVVIMTKSDAAALKAAALSANYGYDPFDGLTVLTTSAVDGYMIVGDLSGAQVNYPAGEGVAFRYDENTLATQDLVRIIGRQYAAHAVTSPNFFSVVTLPTTSA